MPLVDSSYGEKRNFIRMFIDTNVTLTEPETGQTYDGKSKDLSGDGVSIISNHEFKPDQQLEVHIRDEHGAISPLTANLTVTRCIAMEDGMFETAGAIDSVC